MILIIGWSFIVISKQIIIDQLQTGMAQRDKFTSNPESKIVHTHGLVFTLPPPFLSIKTFKDKEKADRNIKESDFRSRSNKSKQNTTNYSERRKRSKSTLQFPAKHETQLGWGLQSLQNREDLDRAYKISPAREQSGRMKNKIIQMIKQSEKHQAREKISSPVLRDPNLMILSKKQEAKRRERIQKKKKGGSTSIVVEQKTSKVDVLPQFANSRSTFYKSKNQQFNTMSILNKTIFTVPTSYFKRKKVIQPLQLEINKLQITDKNQQSFRDKKRRLLKRDSQLDFTHLILNNRDPALSEIKLRSISERKRTPSQIRGWDTQDDYPLQQM